MNNEVDKKNEIFLDDYLLLDFFIKKNTTLLKKGKINSGLNRFTKSIFNMIFSDKKNQSISNFEDKIFDIRWQLKRTKPSDLDEKNLMMFLNGFFYSLESQYNFYKQKEQENIIFIQLQKKSKYSKHILIQINNNPGINQKMIAQKLNLRVNYLSSILKKMDKSDVYYFNELGREKHFYLTQRGKRFVEKAILDEKRDNSVVSNKIEIKNLKEPYKKMLETQLKVTISADFKDYKNLKVIRADSYINDFLDEKTTPHVIEADITSSKTIELKKDKEKYYA